MKLSGRFFVFIGKCRNFAVIMCDQKSQKQLFNPLRRCLNLLFRQQ